MESVINYVEFGHHPNTAICDVTAGVYCRSVVGKAVDTDMIFLKLSASSQTVAAQRVTILALKT